MHGIAARFNFGKGFFFDGGDYNVEILFAGGLQHQKWELAISGD